MLQYIYVSLYLRVPCIINMVEHISFMSHYTEMCIIESNLLPFFYNTRNNTVATIVFAYYTVQGLKMEAVDMLFYQT